MFLSFSFSKKYENTLNNFRSMVVMMVRTCVEHKQKYTKVKKKFPYSSTTRANTCWRTWTEYDFVVVYWRYSTTYPYAQRLQRERDIGFVYVSVGDGIRKLLFCELWVFWSEIDWFVVKFILWNNLKIVISRNENGKLSKREEKERNRLTFPLRVMTETKVTKAA